MGSGSWFGKGTDNGGGGDVIRIKDSDLVPAIDGVPVDEGASLGALDSTGDVGDRVLIAEGMASVLLAVKTPRQISSTAPTGV